MNKKGISPIIATVLLIAIVTTLGAIIFYWSIDIIPKLALSPLSQYCQDVNIEALIVDQDVIDVINRGNIPLQGLSIKIIREAETIVHEAQVSIDTGESITIQFAEYEISIISGDRLHLIPILLDKNTNTEHTCDDRYAYPVIFELSTIIN